jgi:histidyl-tRNA synthetase
LDLRGRGPRAALRYAAHEKISLAVLVGERERASGTVLLRRLATREEVALSLTELPAAALAAVADEEGDGA